ncbi:DUF4288 domain-containing protein [Sciscionella marina]|uniref:DUF4288 domain-containing protein n=1 Tax=Sciscionella marina TaxID=508770 RepID=UPI0012F63D51|nr:DUF4288 domain-containing protein [Sciscionella marina]
MIANRYVALLLFESISSDRNRPALYREDVVLLRASSDETVRRLADAHGRAQECTHRNADGDTISTRLMQIVDVATALDEDLDEDAVDLYARHFRDLDSYRVLDPLLEGEPL